MAEPPRLLSRAITNSILIGLELRREYSSSSLSFSTLTLIAYLMPIYKNWCRACFNLMKTKNRFRCTNNLAANKSFDAFKKSVDCISNSPLFYANSYPMNKACIMLASNIIIWYNGFQSSIGSTNGIMDVQQFQENISYSVEKQSKVISMTIYTLKNYFSWVFF